LEVRDRLRSDFVDTRRSLRILYASPMPGR